MFLRPVSSPSVGLHKDPSSRLGVFLCVFHSSIINRLYSFHNQMSYETLWNKLWVLQKVKTGWWLNHEIWSENASGWGKALQLSTCKARKNLYKKKMRGRYTRRLSSRYRCEVVKSYQYVKRITKCDPISSVAGELMGKINNNKNNKLQAHQNGKPIKGTKENRNIVEQKHKWP